MGSIFGGAVTGLPGGPQPVYTPPPVVPLPPAANPPTQANAQVQQAGRSNKGAAAAAAAVADNSGTIKNTGGPSGLTKKANTAPASLLG